MHERQNVAANRSPVKLALAIGLTIAFLVVVAVQIWRYSDGAKRTPGAGARKPAAARANAASPVFHRTKGPSGVEPAPATRWPVVDLSDCIKYDPFATPPAFSSKGDKLVQKEVDAVDREREIEIAKKQALQEQAISKLRETGVNVVLKGAKQSSAMLGDRLVRVGEEIDGFRVRAIEPDGIVIERPAVR